MSVIDDFLVDPDISMLDKVKIQAQVLVPVVRALRTELGRDKADALVKGALRDWSKRLFAEIGNDIEGSPYRKFAAMNTALADVTMPATLAAARRMLTQEGGLHALVTAALARPSIAPTLAQLGDVVLLAVSEHDADAQALGLCCGEYAAAVTAEGGLTMHPMTNGLAAWRVGA